MMCDWALLGLSTDTAEACIEGKSKELCTRLHMGARCEVCN
jgi:hypothetical protein